MDYTKELHERLRELIEQRLIENAAYLDALLTEIERAHAEVERLQAENRWIPCDERLPEKYVDVELMFFTPFRPRVCQGWYERTQKNGKHRFFHNQGNVGEITHWRNLTCPYEKTRLGDWIPQPPEAE